MLKQTHSIQGVCLHQYREILSYEMKCTKIGKSVESWGIEPQLSTDFPITLKKALVWIPPSNSFISIFNVQRKSVQN